MVPNGKIFKEEYRRVTVLPVEPLDVKPCLSRRYDDTIKRERLAICCDRLMHIGNPARIEEHGEVERE